jgi:aminomethyltransferase
MDLTQQDLPQENPLQGNDPPPSRTPLYNAHITLGGKLIPFAGWELPVQYSGLIQEHKAVRTGVGIFDVSHMGEFWLYGPDASNNLQRLCCNDIAVVGEGQAQYSALLNESGGVIDDLIIYRVAPTTYLLCVNASNITTDFGWITSHLEGDVHFIDRSKDFGLLALQGPHAERVLKMDRELTQLTTMKPFSVMMISWRTIPLIVARTGYTGEDGFEFFTPWDSTESVWTYFVNEHNVIPIGLGARDTLRLEAGYPLHGHELAPDISALESGLNWIVKREKGDFIGREAILKNATINSLIGFTLSDAGIARHGDAVVDENGTQIGVVTSGTRSPTLEKSIGIARLPKVKNVVGGSILVRVRRKVLTGQIVKLPFFQRRKRTKVL